MPDTTLLLQSSNARLGVAVLSFAEQEPGFKVMKRGRSVPRVFDVEPQCTAYAAGMRNHYIVTHVNGVDARSLPLDRLRTVLTTERPLRIAWENDGHTEAAARTLTAAMLTTARTETAAAIVRHTREQSIRRLRRRIANDPSRTELIEYLVSIHSTGQVLDQHHMFLQYGNGCRNCGCRWLEVEIIMSAAKCCQNGAYLDDSIMPQLTPLPDELKNLLTTNTKVVSHQSLKLNQCLNIAAIGLSPSRSEGGAGLIRNLPYPRLQCLSYHGQLYRAVRPDNIITSPSK